MEGICLGVILVGLAALVVIYCFDLFGVRRREISAYAMVRSKLRKYRQISRVALVEECETFLMSMDLRSDWRRDINAAIDQCIDEGFIYERSGILSRLVR